MTLSEISKTIEIQSNQYPSLQNIKSISSSGIKYSSI